MNRLYGYSLKKTLDITQSLRDKHKAITYNRSDSQYLKLEHFNEAQSVTKIVMNNLNKDYPLTFDTMGSCFNDEFAPNHHGIIPQEKTIDINALSVEEANVYKAIAERYLMQFLPPTLAKISTTSFEINQGAFTHKSTIVIDKGWRKYFTDDEKEKTENEESFIEVGNYEVSNISSAIEEKETKPLAQYTEGTLVKDMTSVSKYVKDETLKQVLKNKDKDKKGENGSIGTVATRGAIIETLFNRGYITKDGKNIIATPLGKDFYILIPEKNKNC